MEKRLQFLRSSMMQSSIGKTKTIEIRDFVFYVFLDQHHRGTSRTAKIRTKRNRP